MQSFFIVLFIINLSRTINHVIGSTKQSLQLQVANVRLSSLSLSKTGRKGLGVLRTGPVFRQAFARFYSRWG